MGKPWAEKTLDRNFEGIVLKKRAVLVELPNVRLTKEGQCAKSLLKSVVETLRVSLSLSLNMENEISVCT